VKRADALAALVLVLIVPVELSIARSLSITYDEVLHIAAGISHLERHELVVNAEHPPLMKLLGAALPWALGAREGEEGVRLYPRPFASQDEVKRLQYRYGEAVIARDNERFRFPGAREGADALTVAARIPFVAFPLAVALVGYLWSRARFGPGGGLVTLLLLATYPDLLGHGAIVKNDVPLAALALASGFLLDKLACEGGLARLLALAALTGVALATKFTAVVIAGGLLLSAAFAAARPRDRSEPSLAHPLAGGASAFAGALGLVVAVALSIVVLAYLGKAPYTNYLTGARNAYSEKGGHFLGLCLDRYAPSFRYYFLVALGLKLPLGTIFVVALAILTARRRGVFAEEAILHVTPLLYFAVMSWVALPIGARYVLPSVAFLFVSAGRVAAWAGTSRLRWAPIALALGANAASVAATHPFETSFSNALAGSPRTFYRLLDDSNQDWGGGFKALATWQREHPGPLVVVVHATAFAARNLSCYGVDAQVRLGDVLSKPEKGSVYAVSADVVSRMRLRARERGERLVLGEEVLPEEVVGGGILIFRP
jgi:hypothetical protein